MNRLMTMQYNTDPSLVYEFLSSIGKGEDINGNECWYFRLLNQDRCITWDEIRSHFGFLSLQNFIPPWEEVNVHTLWKQITGAERCNTSKMYISHVQHPVFRIFLKFLSNCILGRPNNHLTRSTDCKILGQYVFPHSIQNQFIPDQMWEHLVQQVTGTGPIVCGGLITHLAVKYGFRPSSPVLGTSLINIDFLRHTKDIVVHHTEGTTTYYKWSIHPNPPRVPILIPSRDMDIALREREHYLLTRNLGDAEGGEELPEDPVDMPHPPTPPPTSPHHFDTRLDQLFEGQQQILQSLANLSVAHTSWDSRLTSLDQRVGQLADDHRAAVADQQATLRPMYAYMDHMGYFNFPGAPVQHPTWYDPTQWGNYGASSSQGGPQGDGDDEADE